jgi:cytochrome P450
MRRYQDLPGPRGLPLVGNLLQVRPERLHLQCEQWAQTYGPLFRLQLADRQVVVVSDHSTVAAILRDRPDTFGRSARLNQVWLEMGLPPGVFGANDEVWRRQRRMVMAGFDPAHVRGYLPAMQLVAGRLGQRWHKAAAQGQAIDLQADLMRYTVDTIAGLAFGAEVNTLESDHDVIQQHLDQIFPALFGRIFSPVPTWRWWRSKANRRLDASLAEVMRAVTGFVAQARQRMAAHPGLHQQPGNLLEAMLVAADQPDSGMDDTQVAGNVLTMLLAGEDTTANTLAWMIHLLWQNPQTLRRATEEVRAVCQAGSAPTQEQLAALDFVEACAREAMRLKPVAPILPLQVQRAVVVGDVQLEPGMLVINLMRVDSVSEAHVPQAAQFKPERWLADGDQSHMAQSAKRISMPFGAGPRICPGRYLALLEMKMAMATLLQDFDILGVDTADGGEPQEHLSFTMTPLGLRMRLQARVAGADARRPAA